MKVNAVNNIVFKAAVRKNSPLVIDGENKNSYDRQIERIEIQKQKALEFDKFMRTRKVKKLIRLLPQDDTLLICDEFRNSSDLQNEIVPSKLFLEYIPKENSASAAYIEQTGEDLYFQEVQDDEGNLDKKAVLDYLRKLNRVLNLKS